MEAPSTRPGGHKSGASTGGTAPAATGSTLRRHEDRWAWRRKIKSDPTLRTVYRFFVAIVGAALMLLAIAVGWLPGPAGIPLFLVGLAILASEFDWAHKLLHRAKLRFRHFEAWAGSLPVWLRWLGGVATLAAVAAGAWAGLAMLGVPGWFPGLVEEPLLRLPGVERPG